MDMRRLLAVVLIVGAGLSASAQIKENVIRMKTVTTPFMETYYNDQLIRVDSVLYKLTRTVAVGTTMRTVIDSGWYKKVGDGSGAVDTTGWNIADKAWVVERGYLVSPMVNPGDLIRNSSDGVPERLGVGTAGQVLTSTGTLPAWATPTSASVDSVPFARSNSRLTTYLRYGDKVHLGGSATPDSTLKVTGGVNITQGGKFGYDITVNGVRIGVGNGNNAGNTAVGNGALNANGASATANVAVGGNANALNSTGSSNTAIGKSSLFRNTGSGNTAVGASAIQNKTVGSFNVAIGADALSSSNPTTICNSNTAIGYQSAISTTGYSNTAVGVSTLYSNTTASNLVAVGDSALYKNTTALYNTAVGSKSLQGGTTYTGEANTAIGYYSGKAATSASNGTFIGSYAGQNITTGGQNTFVGSSAGSATNTGINNTFGGYSSGGNTTSGKGNTFYGYNSGTANQIGFSNTAVGIQALRLTTSGNNNIALGDSAGYAYTTLSNRMYLGARDSTTTGIFWNRTTGINKGYWNGKLNVKTVPVGARTPEAMLVQDTLTGDVKRLPIPVAPAYTATNPVDVTGTVVSVLPDTLSSWRTKQNQGAAAYSYWTKDGYDVYNQSATIHRLSVVGDQGFYANGEAAPTPDFNVYGGLTGPMVQFANDNSATAGSGLELYNFNSGEYFSGTTGRSGYIDFSAPCWGSEEPGWIKTTGARIESGSDDTWKDLGVGGGLAEYGYGNLKFYTRAQANLSERLRITSAGNVGINTTAPTAKLQVAGKKAAPFSVSTDNDGSLGDSTAIYVDAKGQVGIGTTTPTTAFHVGTNALWVDAANGRVGIGNTSPAAGAELKVTGTVEASGSFYSTSGNFYLNRNSYGRFGNANTGTSAGFDVYVKGVFAGRWQANGNLGIGTTSPGEKLDVTGEIRCSDTLRVGNYSTYSYAIPGGNWVTSSTAGVKENITDLTEPGDLFNKVKQINPKKYNFKASAFRKNYKLTDIADSAMVDSVFRKLTNKERKDRLKALNAADSTDADRLSKRRMTGFMAEEINAMLGKPGSKEIDYMEVIALLWKTNQALIRKVEDQEARLKKIEQLLNVK